MTVIDLDLEFTTLQNWDTACLRSFGKVNSFRVGGIFFVLATQIPDEIGPSFCFQRWSYGGRRRGKERSSPIYVSD